jgi:hypothetical protein
MQVRVFLVFCELSGSSPPLRDEGYAGAFVTCVIREDEIISAITQAKRVLEEDQYEIVDIEKVLSFEAEEWTHDEDILEQASLTMKDGEARYSRFDVWGY